MKKVFSFVAVSLALALSASFISCKAPSGGGSSSASKYNVGDIVLNDGSYLRGVPSVSNEDKAKAIAVIYKVDGSKAYGVGLVHENTRGLAWCLDSANGCNTNFTDILCVESEESGSLLFTGDTNGSDNFKKIAQTLGTDDDTETPGNYPAFEFAKNYKNQAKSHISGTSYENGWYLPAISELYDIWKVKATIDAASGLCGGSQFGNTMYWSSSQSDLGDVYAMAFNFNNMCCINLGKANPNTNVCCIHVF